MKIAYNPTTAAALTAAPSNNDITFDLKGVAIYAKGVKFKGTDTTYSVFKKHTASGNTGGYNGLVPVPSYTTTAVRFLREDGSWITPTNTTYNVVSSIANGLAPAIGTTCSTTIATQADEWVLTSTKGGTPTWRKLPTNAFKNDNTNTTYTLSGGLSGNNYTVTLTPSSGSATTATIPAMTGATSSAAGKAGLVPAPGTANTGQFLKGDGTWATPSDTHWTTHLYIGAKDAVSNAATTNGNTYIKVTDNSTIRNQYIIKGSGITTVASDANGNITINTPVNHNLPTSDINKLTGYAIATSAAALTATDTLNTALGKLEYKAHYAYDWIIRVTATDTDEYINKWSEIVGFLDSVKEGTDILDEFVTRKTDLTIIGGKTFSKQIISSVAQGTAPFSVASTTVVSKLNADLLDGVHASGLFTNLSNDTNLLSVTIGGTTKKLTIDYANAAGRLEGGSIATWGTLTSANGYTNVATYDYGGTKGAFSFAGKGGQLSLQLDGFFYQNEGRFLVLDTNNYSTHLDNRYYTETEINNKLKEYLPLAGGTMTLGEGLKFHADENYFGTNLDARIISLLDGNGTICDGGLIIDERCTSNGTTTVTELLRIRDTEFKWRGNNILHAGNFSSILDSRYYTETEANNRFVNITGDTMTGPLNFANNTWNIVGDDSAMGDCNKAGLLGIKSLNNNLPGIAFVNSSGTLIGSLYSDASVPKWSGNTIYHSGNLTKSTIGLGNVQNTAFYKRSTSVNGTAWDMAGAVNSAAFTIFAPTTAGTSNYILKSNGSGAPTWIALSSITAGSANWLNVNSTLTYGASGLNYFNISGTAGNTKANNTPTSAWYHVLRMNHGNSGGYLADIAVPLNDVGGVWWRQIRNGAFYGWYKLLDNNNSAVSGGGSSGGSSITVNLGGTSKTLTIPTSLPANGGTSSNVVVNSSDANSTYRMVWHSGNTLYGTGGIYCNPSADLIYSAGFRHVSYNSASYLLRSDGGAAAFNWSGLGGQPTWLWGGNSQHTYYVYNPSNFSVNYANSAGTSSNTNYLKIHDVRGTNHLPNSTTYPERNITAWFNSTGTPDGNWWSGITVKGWASTYAVWQLCSYSSTGTANNYRLYHRNGINSGWGSWKTIAYTSDIPSVGNGTVTIKLAGTTKGSFTMNQSGNTTIELTDNNTTYSFAAKGSATQGIYLSGTNTFATMTYSLKATVNSGTASKLAYYSGNNAISAHTSTVGSSVLPIYLNAGVPTACSVPMVRYWAKYSVVIGSSNTITKIAGNHDFFKNYSSSVTPGTGGPGKGHPANFPSGYNINNTIISITRVSKASTSSEKYYTIPVVYMSNDYLIVQSNSNGTFHLNFLCIG